MKKDSPTIRVGRIVGAFGLKGQVKIEPFTDFLERFDKGKRLLLKGRWVKIEASQIHRGRPLVKFAGVDDATAAEGLQWEYLDGAEDDRPKLDADEYMTADLVGLRVVTVEGEELGAVSEVLVYPAQDVLLVKDIMIPAVKQFVKNIDLDKKTITVQLIYGMRPGEE